MNIVCPYCNCECELVSGEEVYPHRQDLAHLQFFLCRPCWAYCGTHRNGKPLGTPANGKLRKLRQTAHSVLDPIWKKILDRSEVYRRLATLMSISVDKCHVGMFNEAQCLEALRVMNDIKEIK